MDRIIGYENLIISQVIEEGLLELLACCLNPLHLLLLVEIRPRLWPLMGRLGGAIFLTQISGDVIDELLSGHHKSWMGAWIQVLQREAEKGFHPHIPKWGFGDPKTSEVTVALAGALSVSGAVRHGAECFNFFFPQDLDDEYLIIWDGFTHLNWKNVGPGALRKFLVERANEGYVFPINPKWVIADGWHEVWAAMMNHKEGAEAMKKWYPPETCNILERIEGLKKKYPEGFKPV